MNQVTQDYTNAQQPDRRPICERLAAEARYTNVDQIDSQAVQRWLEKSKTIQWDYQNIVKRKGKLERIGLS